MHFEHTATIAAPRERVWAFLMDVPRVATCVPGVEKVEPLGDDRYRGTIKVKVGPISLSLQGDVAITEQNEETGIATMRADAADKRVGGAVKSVMKMSVQPDNGSATSTVLKIESDTQVMGRIGEFGQPVIRKKADQMMTEFAENVKKTVGNAQV